MTRAAQRGYLIFDVSDGLLLPDLVDISLHPDIGLDEEVHDRDTETDLNFDGRTSIDYSLQRDPFEQRYLDRSADVNQRRSRLMMLTTGNNRVVMSRPRNQLVHPSEDLEDRERREEEKGGQETHGWSEM